MSRRSKRLSTVDQYFVRLRGFDIWRRVQVPKCPYNKLLQTLLNSFGWFGRVGEPGEPANEGQQVLSLQRTEDKGRGGWITITAPPVPTQLHIQPPVRDDEPWFFDAMLEGRLRLATRDLFPRCIDGEWACPPYGYASPGAYRVFLDIFTNPKNWQYDDLVAQCPFDPNAFDAEAVTMAMRTAKWNGRNPIAGLDRVTEGRLRWLSPQSPPWAEGEPHSGSESPDTGHAFQSSADGPQPNRTQSIGDDTQHGDIDLNETAPDPSDLEHQGPPIPHINASFLP